MQLTKSKLLTGAVACAMAVSLMAPPAMAAERQVIDSGHTDAFYVDTTSGTPIVLVNHGLRNDKYNPNAVSFTIGASTYGEYQPFADYLDRGHIGYYSGSEDGDYFEPGWSAPAFRANGFTSMRIDFTDVDGPGDAAILGNRLVESKPFAKFLIETDKYQATPSIADSASNPEVADQLKAEGLSNGTYYLEAGTSLPIFGHTHAHWFFNAPGRYEFTGKAVGTKADGTIVESDPFTTVFNVERADSTQDATPPQENTVPQDSPEQGGSSEGTPPSNPGGNAGGSQQPGGYNPLSDPVTFTYGHMDAFYIGTRSGTPELFLKEDVTSSSPTARVPGSVKMVFVKERYENTGNYNGSIAETAGYHSNAIAPGLRHFSPGWSIDNYRENGFSNAEVHFTSVNGPGRIVLTGTPTLQGTLPSVLADDSLYLQAGSVLPVSGHTHGFWLFTRAGTYTIDAKAVLTKADGTGIVESPVQTYTFVVEANAADPFATTDSPTPDPGSPNTPGPSTPDTPQIPDSDEPSVVLQTPGDKIAQGAEIQAAASGFPAGAHLDASLTALFPPFERLGVASNLPTDNAGRAAFSFRIPSTTKPGMYNLSVGLTGEDPDAFAVVNIGASSPANPTEPSSPTEPSVPSQVITSTEKVEIDHGHLDLFTAISAHNALHLVIKDDSTGSSTLRDPADVTLRIGKNALTTIGEGIAPGLPEKGYFLDAGGLKQQEMLFPGWDTNGVRPHYGQVDFEIVTITTPEGAKAYMFNTKPLGGIEAAFTNGKLEITNGAVIRQKDPAHVHTNWLFSAPGVYTMEVRATATALPGTGVDTIVSNTATYTWKVDEESIPGQQQPALPQIPTPKPESPKAQTPKAPSAPTPPKASEPTDTAGVTPKAPTASAPRSSAATQARATCFPKTVDGNGADALLPRIKDDRTSPGTWEDPATMTFSIGDAGKATTPMGIGAIPQGTSVWMISMSQVRGVPWIGVNTQHPSLTEKTQGPTTFSLTSFSGPGKVEVFEFGRALSPTVGKIWFSGGNGQASGSASVEPNTHVHPNWVFTEPGRYELGITMTTQAKDGSELAGSTTLTIDVGSAGGIDDGHFDLGPTIGAAGSRTVWVDAEGKPCTPTAADLAAAGLAKTGANITGTYSLIAALACIGAALILLRRRSLVTAVRR